MIPSRQRIAVLADDYLSLAIDTSLVLGGHWWGETRGTSRGVAVDRVVPLDLENPRLAAFAALLSPAMLRIGGTEADRVGYRFRKRKDGRADAGAGDELHIERELILRKGLWKTINSFVRKAGFELLFVVSAGPLDRDEYGAWQISSAWRLLAYTAKKRLPVRAWELGNEVNGFPFVHGLAHRVSAAQYLRDFSLFSALVRELHPSALAVGPASAVWPLIGEVNPIIPALGRSTAMKPGAVMSWHYYPQQSSRGALAVRRARPGTLLSPRRLDSVRRCARTVRAAARGRSVWMTETGHALYGGEPGLSDTYLSSIWWLDELGLLAREGVARVFRQSLVGSDYGLLDQASLEPRPDFYASFLWKKLMGAEVYAAPRVRAPGGKIRAYCHGRADGGSGSCLLLVSLRSSRTRIAVEGSIEDRYVLEPRAGLASRDLLLNGVPVDEDLAFGWGKKKTRLKYGAASSVKPGPPGEVDLPAYACAFLVLGVGTN